MAPYPRDGKGPRPTIEEKLKIKPEDLTKLKERVPEEKEIAGYVIYYGRDSKAYPNKIDVGHVTSYRIRGLSNYATYFLLFKPITRARDFSELSR